MCTLLVAWRHYDASPLVVAANRDEQLDREAAGPHAWADRSPALYAPEDLRAGGTWLGLNSAGLFAGLTNRFAGAASPGGISSDRRSRGLVVLDALAEATAEAAFGRIRALPGDLHNPFHLVVADLAGAFVVWSDGWTTHAHALEPGLHVITERSWDAAPSGREDALQGLDVPIDQLRGTLAVHRDEPMSSTCVHAEAFNYGTRTSTWITWDHAGPARFEATEGPSCTHPWVDRTAPMKAALGLSPGSRR